MAASACKPGEERGGEATPTRPDPPAPAPVPITTTVNDFYARGVPSFVLGTAGDARADRAIAMQVELIRSMIFPSAQVIEDRSIDLDAGPSAWPSNPVVYGGPHVNSLIAALGLPFEFGPGRLEIGGRSFVGDHQIIAVIPAGPRNPELVLYAGTGTPGIAEINSTTHGPEAIVVIDAFGRVATGSWQRRGESLEAIVEGPAMRIDWRTTTLEIGRVQARISFPAAIDPGEDEPALIDAGRRGLSRAVERLGPGEPATIDLYVYPDRRSKQSITGNEGDGHAVPMARTLHLLRFEADVFEWLVAHEATHVLAYASWGPAATPLLGEGLAVYVSGYYGGVPLEQWAGRVEAGVSIAELLGPAFRARPENETYPVAGLLVAAAVEQVGLEQVRAHLYGASPQTWAEACERAGTSADALARAVRR